MQINKDLFGILRAYSYLCKQYWDNNDEKKDTTGCDADIVNRYDSSCADVCSKHWGDQRSADGAVGGLRAGDGKLYVSIAERTILSGLSAGQV